MLIFFNEPLKSKLVWLAVCLPMSIQIIIFHEFPKNNISKPMCVLSLNYIPTSDSKQLNY